MDKRSLFRDGPRAVLVAVALLATVGCAEPKRYTVCGVVTLDGQPVADAAVLFEPLNGGAVAEGRTGPDGTFSLQCANKPGVLQGPYFVTVTKKRESGVRADERIDARSYRVEWLVPQRYSNPKTSRLRVQVPSETYEFLLTSQ
jgi:hypothetical protein